jgi:HD-GYP domain-containing protein (c-di-GMP phosphodiesterase class II)
MPTEWTGRFQDDREASRIDARLRQSVRRSIWKMLLWRILPVVGVFVLLGLAIIEVIKRWVPSSGTVQSPAVVLLVTVVILCPLIILSARKVLALVVNLEMAHLELLIVLSKAIAQRDNATEEHNLRVAIMAVHLAIAVGLDRRLIPGLFTGALLHDVGKIGISDSILLKPGKLLPEEWQEMERHVVYGNSILADATLPGGARRVVHYHHERFDGNGYPARRKGAKIPPEARLFAIVDTFDALTSNRPYRQPIALEEALGIMEIERGTHFDPLYLDAFKMIAGALYNRVVRVAPEHLMEQALELVEKYYADHSMQSIVLRKLINSNSLSS